MDRRRARQLDLPMPSTWGGRRSGAGRRVLQARPGPPHGMRPEHDQRHPVHVTLRARPGVPSLRSERLFGDIRRALVASSRRSLTGDPFFGPNGSPSPHRRGGQPRGVHPRCAGSRDPFVPARSTASAVDEARFGAIATTPMPSVHRARCAAHSRTCYSTSGSTFAQSLVSTHAVRDPGSMAGTSHLLVPRPFVRSPCLERGLAPWAGDARAAPSPSAKRPARLRFGGLDSAVIAVAGCTASTSGRCSRRRGRQASCRRASRRTTGRTA